MSPELALVLKIVGVIVLIVVWAILEVLGR